MKPQTGQQRVAFGSLEVIAPETMALFEVAEELNYFSGMTMRA